MVGGKRSRRHAGKAGRRGRWLRSLAAAAGVLVVAGGLAAAGTADGYPASRPKLLSGAAWLASSQVGQLTLLDGSSAEVSAQVSVAPRGNRIDVVQQAATAYVVDRTAGSLRRVDGATFDVGAVAKPIPDATGGLLAFAGPRGLYALDSSRGLLVATDPLSLTAKGAAVSLASRFDAGGAVVDEHGRLWVLDSATGDLIWLDGGKRGLRRGAVTAGAGLLVLADDAPVLVDTTARRADVLDRSTAQVRRSVTLDLRPGEQIAVSGSPHAARLYIAAARGVLSVCELTRADCATAVPLSPDATDLGSPVETGGRVFVPDYRTGQVWIVDLAGARVVARPQVLHPRTKFQLLTRDGLVFFNDPDSEQAGVIDLDGGFTPVAKYDPAHPDRNLHNPGAGGRRITSKKQPPAGQPPVDQPQQPDTPDKAPPNKTPPPQPDPPKPPDPPSPPVPGQPRVRIVVSNTDPFVGDPVTLRATGVPGGPEPTAARWDFGDGQGGMGLRVNHQWDTPRNYQVSVQVTFPDNRTATSSITLRVATRPVTRPVLTVQSPTNGVISGTGGINCPSTCAATFDAGQRVILNATPSPGIVSWGGACAGAGRARTCALTMNGDKAVSIRFDTRKKLLVTSDQFEPNGGAGVQAPGGLFCQRVCTWTFDPGQQITLTAFANGLDFLGWGRACASRGQNLTCTLVMDRDQRIRQRYRHEVADRHRRPVPGHHLHDPAPARHRGQRPGLPLRRRRAVPPAARAGHDLRVHPDVLGQPLRLTDGAARVVRPAPVRRRAGPGRVRADPGRVHPAGGRDLHQHSLGGRAAAAHPGAGPGRGDGQAAAHPGRPADLGVELRLRAAQRRPRHVPRRPGHRGAQRAAADLGRAPAAGPAQGDRPDAADDRPLS